jgi:HEAT repeat protein
VRGRIYRVVWNQAKAPAIRTLGGAAIADLVKALSSDAQFWRLTAQRLLVEGKRSEATPALKEIVRVQGGSVAAIHALWALHGLAALATETHRAALASEYPALRRNAIRALGVDGDAAAQFQAANVAKDPDPATRLTALVKLAELPASLEATATAGALHNDAAMASDEWLREASKVVGRSMAVPLLLAARGKICCQIPPLNWRTGNCRRVGRCGIIMAKLTGRCRLVRAHRETGLGRCT